MKRYIILLSVVAGLTYGQEDIIIAVNNGEWENSKVWNHEVLPTGDQKVWVDSETTLYVRKTVSAGRISLGDGHRTGGLIIDGGTLNTLSKEWVAVGYSNNAMLKVMNGGSLVTDGRLSIGLKDENHKSLAEVIVEDGEIVVNGLLEIGKNYDGVSTDGKQVACVAILRLMGGRVSAEGLSVSLDGNCRINLSGGHLVLEGDYRRTIEEYIADERIFAFSKVSGSKVEVEYANGQTIVRGAETPKSLGFVFAGL